MKKSKKIKPLPHGKIIELLITPRAAIDRILSSGRVDEQDLGALECCYVLAVQTENISGKECPDINVMQGLVQQIKNGMEVLEERLERCKQWLDDYARYLRTVDQDDFRKAIAKTVEACRS